VALGGMDGASKAEYRRKGNYNCGKIRITALAEDKRSPLNRGKKLKWSHVERKRHQIMPKIG